VSSKAEDYFLWIQFKLFKIHILRISYLENSSSQESQNSVYPENTLQAMIISNKISETELQVIIKKHILFYFSLHLNSMLVDLNEQSSILYLLTAEFESVIDTSSMYYRITKMIAQLYLLFHF
jgi:hypothetical protein